MVTQKEREILQKAKRNFFRYCFKGKGENKLFFSIAIPSYYLEIDSYPTYQIDGAYESIPLWLEAFEGLDFNVVYSINEVLKKDEDYRNEKQKKI